MGIHILECRRFSGTYTPSNRVRTVKDYEIDLELGDDRQVVIDGIPRMIRRGNICIRKPGQTIYGRSTRETVTQSSILLTVDFSGSQSADRYNRHTEGPRQPAWDSPLLEQLEGVIIPKSESTFIPIYTELLRLTSMDQQAAELLVMELIYKLNAEQCRQHYLKTRPADTSCSRVMNYLKNNLDKAITLDFLAESVHLNKNYLVQLFRETYGQTPIQVLIDLRMSRAFQLLVNTDWSVSQIAAACGYSSASYFTAEFKKHFGTTPLKHRRDPKNNPF